MISSRDTNTTMDIMMLYPVIPESAYKFMRMSSNTLQQNGKKTVCPSVVCLCGCKLMHIEIYRYSSMVWSKHCVCPVTTGDCSLLAKTGTKNPAHVHCSCCKRQDFSSTNIFTFQQAVIFKLPLLCKISDGIMMEFVIKGSANV